MVRTGRRSSDATPEMLADLRERIALRLAGGNFEHSEMAADLAAEGIVDMITSSFRLRPLPTPKRPQEPGTCRLPV